MENAYGSRYETWERVMIYFIYVKINFNLLYLHTKLIDILDLQNKVFKTPNGQQLI
jgi:hypothetical protein